MATRKLMQDVWEEHTRAEFQLKDVEATMLTMTAQPVVYNIPTMLGGNGYDEVYRFYKNHFIGHLPKQTEVTSISCTVDDTRLVDEVLFSFVHDSSVDFMLPNIVPTGKSVRVPLIAIVYFEGDKIAKEHIYWDQASVLKQIGLIQEASWPVFGREQAKPLLVSR